METPGEMDRIIPCIELHDNKTNYNDNNNDYKNNDDDDNNENNDNNFYI